MNNNYILCVCPHYFCSPVTPPGTKIKLTGPIIVINGFITLKKCSTQVLGGSVEALMKKWQTGQVSKEPVYAISNQPPPPPPND